jgi:DNA-binding Lrp family transcriptional regulator
VDDLDLNLLRESSRGRIMWWGSLDPRISYREIARRLRIDPTTVWNRFRTWRREGFLLGYSVVPNPNLFQIGLAGGSVRIGSPAAKPGFFRDFGSVEGAAFAVDQVGDWVVVMFVVESERGLKRSVAQTRHLEGVSEMEPCIPFRCPPTTMIPAPRDWQVLETLRVHPASDLSECARSIPMSTKAFARRCNALIEDKAIWSIPRLDFSRYRGATVARLLIWLDPKAEAEHVLQRLRNEFPMFILLEDQSGIPNVGSHAVKLLSVFLQLSTASEIEDVDRSIRGVHGVAAIEIYFPRQNYVYDDWAVDRIQTRIRAIA